MTVEVKSRNVGNLRVYQLARDLEEQVFELTSKLPDKEKYMLADHLRRSATACAHFIAEAHGHYSYTDKVKTLYRVIDSANEMLFFLQQHDSQNYGNTAKLQDDYTGVIRQTWGLIKYLKNKPAASATGPAATKTSPQAKVLAGTK